MKDLKQLTSLEHSPPQLLTMPVKSVKIHKVTSLADFKKRVLDFKSLKKAVIVGEKLFVEARPSVQ